MPKTFMLKARTGRAFRLVQGAQLRVANTFGSRVIDAWAFMADDIAEFIRWNIPASIPPLRRR
ncbi:DUF1989 domain-containing protein [Ruegeria arenilitoris]|uniref:DUF1989 domain-containing protein n=1 Tax=Ruegeria arenilitoris TaxID=1173585 RepID=UPI00147E1E1B|nr:DUF1989 domain-containing protein [Ruegeria arenilitoris]